MKTKRGYLCLLIALITLIGVSLACGKSSATNTPKSKVVSTEKTIIEESVLPTKTLRITFTPKATTTSRPTGTSKPSYTPKSTNTLKPTDTPKPTDRPVPDLYLGDSVESFGYALVGVSVSDPATQSEYYTLEPGKKLIAVEVIVGNVSGDIETINPLDFTLVDNDGFVYTGELGAIENQLQLVELNQGEKVHGWVAFSVPENTEAESLKYELGHDKALQANLKLPPAGYTQVPITQSPNPSKPLNKLGDAVEDYGYALVGVSISDPATQSEYYTLEPGKKLIAVEAIVGNVSGDMDTINPLDFYLVDSYGFVYTAELGAIENQMQLVDLDQGEKVRGWIAFVVSESTAAESLKYDINYENKLITSLLLPPADHVLIPISQSPNPVKPLNKLGETVEGFGYSLSAVTIEDPGKPSPYYKLGAGNKLVAIEIVVGNISGEQITVNPLDFYLVDSDGFVYTSELGASNNQIELVDLNQGEKVKGWVAFAIPVDAKAESIKHNVGSDEYLQIGVTE